MDIPGGKMTHARGVARASGAATAKGIDSPRAIPASAHAHMDTTVAPNTCHPSRWVAKPCRDMRTVRRTVGTVADHTHGAMTTRHQGRTRSHVSATVRSRCPSRAPARAHSAVVITAAPASATMRLTQYGSPVGLRVLSTRASATSGDSQAPGAVRSLVDHLIRRSPDSGRPCRPVAASLRGRGRGRLAGCRRKPPLQRQGPRPGRSPR